jgi:predicted aspartyl protease
VRIETHTVADPTRRLLLAGGASLALAPFNARARNCGPPVAPAPGVNGTEAEPRNSNPETVADDAARLTVAVTLNGAGPFDFIVDTGADRTVIADDLVEVAGMVRGAQVLVEGVIRSTVAETAFLSRLRFGSSERRNLKVPTLPRELLKADGYLGLDVIDGHKVTFDFKNRLLTVGAPRSFFAASWYGDREETVAVRGSSGHLRTVNCMADGVRTAAFIDTGAEVSACNSSLLHALMRGKATQGTSGTVALSGVTGGRIEGTVTLIDKIQLEDLALTQCAVVVANFEIFKIWGLAGTPALLIGMNLLRSFAKVSIDYGRKELRFELSNARQPEVLASARATNLT